MNLNINGKTVDIADDIIKKALEEKKDAIDITTDKILVRTPDEENSFKENIRKEGITIGAEVGRKNILKTLGIEGEGVHKSDDTTIEAIKGFSSKQVQAALVDAGKEPDKKLQEKEKDINTLKTTIAELQGKLGSTEGEFKTYKKTQVITSSIMKYIPDNTVLPKEDMLDVIKNKIKADVDDNGNIFALGEDGQPIKDKTTLNPIPFKDAVAGFFDQNKQYLKGATGGAAGGDSGASGGGKQSLDDFQKEMAQAGHAPNSPGFIAEMQARIKAKTLEV